MDSKRWQKLQALFHETADLPPTEWKSHLESTTGNDRELVEEALALLEVDAGDSVLDTSLAGIAHQVLLENRSFVLPREFGPYRLLRILGEGGMGLVYLAERKDLGSKVAIKFLRDAWLSPARRERFAGEQHLLAQLAHPSIARLYDADTLPDGTPWFVMEYVDGIPLTKYCREHSCTVEQRLQLFRLVCEAVQYAHRHAVIHRDLKPSNILVKEDRTVRLLDFGIAKQIENLNTSVDQTLTGLRLLTPAYAAPEQIRGEQVGVHMDVYSLGVMLFELLSGQLPFDLANLTPAEAASIIVSHDPGKPSTRCKNGDVPDDCIRLTQASWADLDILCLTAMHKDPLRRYRSVEALIRDIDHYFNGEPLEARPDSVRYKARKFFWRNWRAVTTVTLVIAVVVGLTTVFAWRLAKARNMALAEAARTQRIQRFMINIFQGGDAVAGPSADLRIVDMLDRSARDAQALQSDPKVRAELLFNLADIYRKQAQLDKAETLFLLSLEQRKLLYGADSAEVAEALTALGMLRFDQSRFEEAESLARQGLGMAERHLSANDPVVVAAIVGVGRVLGQRGKYDEAINLLERASQSQSFAAASAAEQTAVLSALADVNYSAGHYDVCQPLYRRLIDMHLQIYGPHHPLLAEDFGSLSATLIDLGFYSDAETSIRHALEVTRAYYGNDNPKVAANLTTLGRSLLYQSRYDEAATALQQALVIQQRAFGPIHSSIAETLNELGNIASKRDQLDDAEAKFRHVAEIYRTIYGDRHFYVAIALSNIATVRLNKKDYASAEIIYRDVVRRFTETLSSDNINTGIAQVKLGRTLLREKRFAEAEAISLAGYKVLQKQSSPTTSFMQNARKDLVAEYTALNQRENAARFQAELQFGNEAPATPVSRR